MEGMMDWQYILETKKQSFHFSKKNVDKQIIQDIIAELHKYCPSKQNMTPYKIKVLGPQQEKTKIKLFKRAVCEEKDDIFDVRNPQILAPYTFCIYAINRQFPTEATSTNPICGIEVGMVGLFLAYSAINKGLAIGFCQCTGTKGPDLILGVGYADDTEESTYFNPVANCLVDKKFTGPDKKIDKNSYITLES